MRIISGKYGGRPLKAVKGNNTRPTTDKIKESLFHMIGPYFEEGQALDLYAGSGSLGIEAVSRGMDKAFLIDNHPLAIKTIHDNVSMTKEEEKFIVWKKKDTQALEELKRKNETFNLVFLDPPYAKQTIADILALLTAYNLLAPYALIICETDKDTTIELPDDSMSLVKEKHYGTTKIAVYEWGSTDD